MLSELIFIERTSFAINIDINWKRLLWRMSWFNNILPFKMSSNSQSSAWRIIIKRNISSWRDDKERCWNVLFSKSYSWQCFCSTWNYIHQTGKLYSKRNNHWIAFPNNTEKNRRLCSLQSMVYSGIKGSFLEFSSGIDYARFSDIYWRSKLQILFTIDKIVFIFNIGRNRIN